MSLRRWTHRIAWTIVWDWPRRVRLGVTLEIECPPTNVGVESWVGVSVHLGVLSLSVAYLWGAP